MFAAYLHILQAKLLNRGNNIINILRYRYALCHYLSQTLMTIYFESKA